MTRTDNLTTQDVVRAQLISALATLGFSLDQEVTLMRHTNTCTKAISLMYFNAFILLDGW